MSMKRIMMVAVALASAGGVLAQAQTDAGTPPTTADGGSLQSLCIDTTGEDQQPDFRADAGIPSAILLVENEPPGSDPKLRLNTNLNKLDPERIILPFDQNLDALIVDDQAGGGASHTLGWFYYDELIDAGYIDIRDAGDPNDDVLKDTNNNRVPDFHEDLYNVSAGANARPYVGLGARCPGRTFTHTLADGGGTVTLRDPDLLTGPCTGNGTTSYIANNGPKRWDDRTGYPPEPTGLGGVVGQRVRDFVTALLDNGTDTGVLKSSAISSPALTTNLVDTYFSDQGLFPHVPNLLEPRHELNGNRGIGHFVFLSTDDDGNTCRSSPNAECFAPRMAWKRLEDGGTAFVGPIWDTSTGANGVPDYKASAIDPSGQVIGDESVTAAITKAEDQRVQLGKLQGNREIVFFLHTYVEQRFGGTDSCLITRPSGDSRELQCDLWLHGDINTFFSKSLLNMDLHQSVDPLVVTNKNLSTDWLGGNAYTRLATDSAYGGITFPANQTQNVKSYNRRAAHTLVGAPANNPLVWLLGWEDQVGGGNRTYDDIVILINKQNNGSFRSDVVSNIPIEVADDFTITEVAFDVVDQPYFVPDGGSLTNCSKTTPLADGGTGTLRPEIRYEVALDCQIPNPHYDPANPDAGPRQMVNPEPNWLEVNLGGSDGGIRDAGTVVTDLMERGRVGTQLCWRAILESPGEACQPTILDVHVTYKAQRSGQYGRASVIPMANAVVYGVRETPGRTWFDGGVDEVSTRVFDGYADTVDRGHLHLKKLYNADSANLQPYDPADPVWDSGKWLRDLMDTLEGTSTVTDPVTERKLLTRDPTGGQTLEVATLLEAGDINSPAFPNTLCSSTYRSGTKYLYDLDQNGTCNPADRTFLRDWLYGWENRNAASVDDRLRTWPMGGIMLSTPAVIGPAGVPGWVLRTSNRTEQDQYLSRFMRQATVANRPTVTYVGTTQGYLHAVKTGAYKPADDPCTARAEGQGYFARPGACSTARDYGDGKELFAYLPYKQLPYYVENYRRTSSVPGNPTADARAKLRASMDATPNVADVDLGQGTEYTADTGYTPTANNAWVLNTTDVDQGAKTVLASATGPNQSVFFALDVTDPTSTNYPRAMWEFDMKNDPFANNGTPCSNPNGSCKILPTRFADAGAVVKPDTQGSRHAPAITRMDFGPGGKKWVSIFATDYVPASGTVGTVYIMDMKTGLPVQLPGNNVQSRLAGVVTLGKNVADDLNQGIGGEPVTVDINQDGVDDVIYVPSTSGKIYRINTTLTDISNQNKLGKVLSSCIVADAKLAPGVQTTSRQFQRIFSSISAQVVTASGGNSVRLYFGTGNNPDIANEAADTASPRPRYYVMAYDDRSPTPNARPANGECLANHAWTKELDDGQVVWGGVAATDQGVFTTTAVGKSANVCGLSSSESGKAYAFTTAGQASAGNGTDLGGHGTHAPVVHDRHLVFLTADGKVVSKGSEPYGSTGSGAAGRKSNILIWDVRSGTRIQEAVP